MGFSQVRDVFLPWYNAYRFLVQNAKRLEIEGFAPFVPVDQATLQKSFNVLDQWINSATQSLVYFVRKEMDGYRLYTVRHLPLIFFPTKFSTFMIDIIFRLQIEAYASYNCKTLSKNSANNGVDFVLFI